VSASLAYSQNPKPIGYPVSFRLEGERLIVDTGRRVQEVRLAAVERVRLTYEPKGFASRAFRTRLFVRGGPTVTFTSVHWRSPTDAGSQDADYAAFSRAVLAAVGRANPGARFTAGKSAFVWYASIALAAVTLVTVAMFTWRAFTQGAHGAALLGALVGAVGIWQIEPIIRLNKPRAFTADAPPGDLLPG